MGMGNGPSRTVKFSTFVAGLILALSLPSIALASPVAFFQNVNPTPGSSSAATSRMLSVTVYDRYGVRYMTNMTMSLDGVQVKPTWKPWSGYGFRKFTLKYAAMNMAPGVHTAAVRIHDQKNNTVNYSWNFTVLNVTLPPIVPFVHATVANSCTTAGSGCHSGNIASIHAGGPNGGCANCHALSVAPMSDCAACHATLPNFHSAATHKAIVSSATIAAQTCTQAICHGDSGSPIAYNHKNGCAECHDSTRAGVPEAILAGGATCESCHDFATIHSAAKMTTGHTVSGSCFASTCHGTNVATMHTIDFRGTGAATIPGCAACHAPGKTPSTDCQTCHADLVTPHDYVKAHAGATASYTVNVTAMLSTNSSACVACHGNDLTAVLPANTYADLPAAEHKGCSCHAYGEAGQNNGLLPAGQVGCQNCHGTAQYGAHEFGAKNTVSGHNTTTFGTIGAKSRFDGSQGATLTDTVGNTVETTWGLPTVNVFWSQNPANAPAGANTTVGWDSVITCQDCHTGLNAAGPHGASNNFGIDPQFPYPYADAVNSHVTESGIAARTTTDVTTPRLNSTQAYPTTSTPTNWTGVMAAELSHGLVDGGQPGTSYAVICAKCHKLFDYESASLGVTAVSHGPTWLTTTGISNDSNTAHGSHHFDLNNGAADCVSCHVAIPHGWVRPRLLVNGFTGTYTVTSGGTTQTVNSVADAAPYWGGRGMLSKSGAFIGMGPLSATDDHSLTAEGGALWDESSCIACAGSSTSTVNPSGLEHVGVPTEPAKLK